MNLSFQKVTRKFGVSFQNWFEKAYDRSCGLEAHSTHASNGGPYV